jgi:hypothetical protein
MEDPGRPVCKWVAGTSRYVHDLIAEAALGKRLPPKAVVHHVDGVKQHNAGSNLVICENRAYHALLHQRTRVVRAGGNPNIDKLCYVCKQPKPLIEFGRNVTTKDGHYSICPACRKATRGSESRARAQLLRQRQLGG